MKSLTFVLSCTIVYLLSTQCVATDKIKRQIEWTGNWGYGCDFHTTDLMNIPSRDETCAEKCESTPSCTHFTWTTFNEGTCWMKQGPISKYDAFSTNDYRMKCGIIEQQPFNTINQNYEQKTNWVPVVNDIPVQKTNWIPVINDVVVQKTNLVPVVNDVVVHKTNWVPEVKDVVVQKTDWVPKVKNVVIQKTSWVPEIKNVVVQKTNWVPEVKDFIVKKTDWVPEVKNVVEQKTNWIPVVNQKAKENTNPIFVVPEQPKSDVQFVPLPPLRQTERQDVEWKFNYKMENRVN